MREIMLDEARDLSQVPGMNPTKWIFQHYDDLKIMNATELGQLLLSSIPQMGNFGRQNAREFVETVRQLTAENATDALRKYITNFMMKGMGYGVIECVIGNDVESIASVITEDVNVTLLTPELSALKKLVETGTNLRIVLRG
jgi:hypothetical protein